METIDRSKEIRQLVDGICKEALDRGRLIEAGWLALRHMSIPVNASEVQVKEMRNSFFAGAQHVLSSILGVLEPGAEPTEKDMQRMSLIHDELNNFIKEYKQEHFT